jgi:hypothetical protein
MLGARSKSPHVLLTKAAIVGFRRSWPAVLSPARASAIARCVGPLCRHSPAGCKRLVERFDGARCRLRAVAEIDAVFAGQAREGDPERAQLGRRQLEEGRGPVAVHLFGIAPGKQPVNAPNQITGFTEYWRGAARIRSIPPAGFRLLTSSGFPWHTR